MDVLITSPVRRALQTTRYVRETTGQHVHVWANVFEEGGIYRGHGPEAIEGGPGLTRSEVLDHIAESAAQCTLDDVISSSGWWGSKPRESSEAAAARAREVVGRLTQTFRDGHVVVMIIHADLKRRLLVEMIGEDHNPQIFGKLRNVGITKLDYVNDRWQLDWFNSVSHLPAQLITGNE
jgi:2,3-bisphosphoglycerate-dependent phosphoglycerate mutase